ncbi:phosphate butyryltransferase [Caldanaerobacter sp.]|uniref:phosphate butyryltransferase n=1 Tax=Caldanaerobacter sp. TaxID=2930036 RepID=UPI003C74DF71
MRTFAELYEHVKNLPPKVIAVAQAADEDVLEAIKEAHEKGIVRAILVGDKEKIERIASSIGMSLKDHEIVEAKSNLDACREAVRLVNEGKADILMKGLVQTAEILKVVLDKEIGLRTGRTLSHVAVFESPYERLILLTDAAMNIAPDLKVKIDIILNAIDVAKQIGIDAPRVAILGAVETVNPDMQATLDAAILSKMSERGQIKGAIIDGPLALDNALSIEAARHKGIVSPVAGNADILVVPDIEAGNILYKAITYIAQREIAGIIMGAKKPIVLTSRADSSDAKFNSIMLASLASNV